MDIRDIIIFGAFALSGFAAFMSLLWMCCDVSKGFDDEEYWNEYWNKDGDDNECKGISERH